MSSATGPNPDDGLISIRRRRPWQPAGRPTQMWPTVSCRHQLVAELDMRSGVRLLEQHRDEPVEDGLPPPGGCPTWRSSSRSRRVALPTPAKAGGEAPTTPTGCRIPPTPFHRPPREASRPLMPTTPQTRRDPLRCLRHPLSTFRLAARTRADERIAPCHLLDQATMGSATQGDGVAWAGFLHSKRGRGAGLGPACRCQPVPLDCRRSLSARRV